MPGLRKKSVVDCDAFGMKCDMTVARYGERFEVGYAPGGKGSGNEMYQVCQGVLGVAECAERYRSLMISRPGKQQHQSKGK